MSRHCQEWIAKSNAYLYDVLKSSVSRFLFDINKLLVVGG